MGRWLAVPFVVCLALPAAAQDEVVSEAEPDDSDPQKTACLESFGVAQRSRRAGKLVETAVELQTCAQSACPEIVAGKCTEWLEEVRAAIPSIVVVARDGSGKDLVNVTVLVDGRIAATQLDGRGIEVDPGPHDVTLAHGTERLTLRVVAVEGEKGRRVEARFGPAHAEPVPVPPPPSEERFAVPAVSWVAFAVGGASLVAGAVTGGLALQRSNDLEEACGGTVCPTSLEGDFDEGVALANASTATLTIGGVAVAVGIVTLVVLGGPAQSEVGLGRDGVVVRW
jgi:hypothetical protein